jgi:hypothetical protein
MIDQNDMVPKSKGSRYEIMEGENVRAHFAFEPDPEYSGGRDSFCIDVQTVNDPDGCMFFSSLDEIEEFADQLKEYVRAHRK